MKIITLAIATLIAAAAQAGTYTYHDYDAALRGIALNNACITGTEVRTIAPQRVCAQLNPVVVEGNGDSNMTHTEWVCAQWVNANLAFSRSFQKTVCAEYEAPRGDSSGGGCTRSEVVNAFLPATIQVGSYNDKQNEAGSDWPGTSSSFTFPSCK